MSLPKNAEMLKLNASLLYAEEKLNQVKPLLVTSSKCTVAATECYS